MKLEAELRLNTAPDAIIIIVRTPVPAAITIVVADRFVEKRCVSENTADGETIAKLPSENELQEWQRR